MVGFVGLLGSLSKGFKVARRMNVLRTATTTIINTKRETAARSTAPRERKRERESERKRGAVAPARDVNIGSLQNRERERQREKEK